MGAHDLIHQRQPEPGALHVVHQPGLDPYELLEDALLVARRDADARGRPPRPRPCPSRRAAADTVTSRRCREYLIALSSRLSTQWVSAVASARTGGQARRAGRPRAGSPGPRAAAGSCRPSPAPASGTSTGSNRNTCWPASSRAKSRMLSTSWLSRMVSRLMRARGTSRRPRASEKRRISSVSTASRISAIGVLSSWRDVRDEARLELRQLELAHRVAQAEQRRGQDHQRPSAAMNAISSADEARRSTPPARRRSAATRTV